MPRPYNLISERKCNHVGKKFGKLTVLGLGKRRFYNSSGRKKGFFMWSVQCDCGVKKEVMPCNLRNGETVSCGCFLDSKISEFGMTKLRELFGTYRYNAKKKGLEFDLTIEIFKELVSKNCIYCDAAPVVRNKKLKKGRIGQLPCNGVDRKNNSIGYTIDNSAPCCPKCNMMKKDLKYDEFLIHIGKINDFQLKKKVDDKMVN